MRRNPKIEQLIKDIDGLTFDQLCEAHGASVVNAGTLGLLLESSGAPFDEQIIVLALILGQIHASCDGEMSEADKDGLVSNQDRIDIFMAFYRVAFTESARMKAEYQKAHPDDQQRTH